jgi:hypothetical protein
LSNLKFDHESKISTFDHLYQFIDKCKSFDITNDNEICKLFTLTFQGRTQKRYKVIPGKSIHSWNHFMHVFLLAHQNYNFEKLCLGIENISMHAYESLDEFYAIFMSLCFIFHIEDLPSIEDPIECFTSLVLPANECRKSNEDKHDVLHQLVNFDSTSNFIEPCWQPPMIFDHNQSSHKEIISFYSCHHLSFVNIYVLEFRSDDWIKIILLSFYLFICIFVCFFKIHDCKHEFKFEF